MERKEFLIHFLNGRWLVDGKRLQDMNQDQRDVLDDFFRDYKAQEELTAQEELKQKNNKMKTTITFLLLFLTIGLTAQNMNRIDGSNPTNETHKPRKYCYLSIGVDPSNLLNGGKRLDNGEQRNEKAFDIIARLGVGFETESFGSWEGGITGEIFNAIDYKSIGLDANFVFELSRTQMILFGGEGIFIFREGLDDLPKYKKDSFTHFAPALNLRYRAEAILGTPFFAEAHVRYVYRTDIGYFWGKDEIPTPDLLKSYSGYISIGVKF